MSDTSIVILIIGSIAITVFTWFFSFRVKRPHGIPRFFAFESILLLIIFNAPVWFNEPLAWNQIASWFFLLTSIIFAIWGFLLLILFGKPEGDIENTTKLVTVGLYRYIRHPLYASVLFLGIGVFLKNITPATAILAMISAIASIATAKREEKEMLTKFGKDYIGYMNKTKMFIPYIL